MTALRSKGTAPTFEDALALALRAGTNAIHIRTVEEERALRYVEEVGTRVLDRFRLHLWDSTGGARPHGDRQSLAAQVRISDGAGSGNEVLHSFEEMLKARLCDAFILFDPGAVLSNPLVARALRHLVLHARLHNMFVIVVQDAPLPDPLEREFYAIDLELPTSKEISAEAYWPLVDSLAKQDYLIHPWPRDHAAAERLCAAATGLTLVDATDAIAKALVTCQHLHEATSLVHREKKALISRAAGLEFVDAAGQNFDVLGGFDGLRRWVDVRRWAWESEASQFGVSMPKGATIVGFPGCGKSAAATAVAGSWGIPLVRMDLGAMYGSLLGETEANLRHALRVVRSVSPCVLWVDEVEKVLAGATADFVGDGGVAKGVLATLLTWMQEQSGVFMYFTANAVDRLPQELLRKGRIDELFFVDLPSYEDRIAILAIHLRAAGFEPASFDLEKVADQSSSFTGAEIEQVVRDAALSAYAEIRSRGAWPEAGFLTTEALSAAVRRVVPMMAKNGNPQIEALRSFAASDFVVRVSGT